MNAAKYPHDDDWGDYELERRRAKELDRKHDEMSIFELLTEIQRLAKEMAAEPAPRLSDFIGRPSFHDTSDTCQSCGKKHRGGFGCTCGDRP
jgi:hypothetical protein